MGVVQHLKIGGLHNAPSISLKPLPKIGFVLPKTQITERTLSERWLPVVGFEGRYEVSDLGRVRSVTRSVTCSHDGRRVMQGRILLPWPNSTGHLEINLGRAGRRRVHRLVLEAFVGPCPPGEEALHGPDHTPANNRLDNLRWGTRSDNIRDAVRNGTWHSDKRKAGARSPARLAAWARDRQARWER